jgi:hypothetical protein
VSKRSALWAVAAVSRRLKRVRGESGYVHDDDERIVGDPGTMTPYFVRVRRRGVSPLEQRLLVRATSRRMAGEVASWIAARGSGGIFEAVHVSRSDAHAFAPVDVFDDADFWPSHATWRG